MIRTEYLRFLQTLNDAGVAAGVRKIANLVLDHFDTLNPLSTSQGQRIKKMVQLAQTNWASISADIQPIPKQIM
jgi:DNA sulfur modification protein DndD